MRGEAGRRTCRSPSRVCSMINLGSLVRCDVVRYGRGEGWAGFSQTGSLAHYQYESALGPRFNYNRVLKAHILIPAVVRVAGDQATSPHTICPAQPPALTVLGHTPMYATTALPYRTDFIYCSSHNWGLLGNSLGHSFPFDSAALSSRPARSVITLPLSFLLVDLGSKPFENLSECV